MRRGYCINPVKIVFLRVNITMVTFCVTKYFFIFLFISFSKRPGLLTGRASLTTSSRNASLPYFFFKDSAGRVKKTFTEHFYWCCFYLPYVLSKCNWNGSMPTLDECFLAVTWQKQSLHFNDQGTWTCIPVLHSDTQNTFRTLLTGRPVVSPI